MPKRTSGVIPTAAIETAIREHVSSSIPFTSVDIANSVKLRGNWAATREVSSALHAAQPWLDSVGYRAERIHVVRAEDGARVAATLYLPVSSDTSDYDATAQKPITPDAFRAMFPAAADPTPSVPVAPPVVDPVSAPVANPASPPAASVSSSSGLGLAGGFRFVRP